MSRREGGRGLATIEESVDASIQRLEVYIEKRRGRLIIATRNNTNDTRTSRTTITRKQRWGENQLCGRFKRLTSDISHEKMWTWLRKGNHKRKTESLLIAAQKNTIRTNHIKTRIDKVQQNSSCTLCDDSDETIRGCPRGVMVKAMDCEIVVSEFVLQSRYYVHFRANPLGKGMNPLILPTNILQGEWLLY